ncbi:hypothetical protein ACRALDRAFT_1053715 [Sodiomyces alcalophilus JCM 7366]|uniref:uncharacterized protein n=1 Tax=Sodiomyces alcalophilus JCM 7366 TaxID=591952 RepID=UPI0039B42CBC
MGRKRRSSNSTVATVDEDRIKYVEETSVLKIPSIDENDWDKTYVLEDVTIYGKDGQMADLLYVSFLGPVTVRGFIRAEGNQASRFIKRSPKSTYIEIRNCATYSVGIGEGAEKTPCVWAGGRCGWYEIRPPSVEYTPIYTKMAEAVSLYYNMLDVHMAFEEPYRRKKGKKMSRVEIYDRLDPDTMFFKFAVNAGDGAVYQEVVASCDEHAPFLISHFYEEDKSYFDWEPTTLFKWLTSRHPKLTRKVLENELKKRNPAVVGKIEPQELVATADDPPVHKSLARSTQRASAQPETSAEAEVASRDFASKRGSRRSRKTDETTTPLPTTASPAPQPMDIDPDPAPINANEQGTSATPATPRDGTSAVVRALVDGIEEIRRGLNVPLSAVSKSKIWSKLYYNHKIKNYNAASEMLTYYAPELLAELDAGVWAGSSLHNHLLDAAKSERRPPELFDPDRVIEQLVKRDRKMASSTAAEPSTSKRPSAATNGAALQTPQRRTRGRPSGKTSILRPSSKRPLASDDASEASVRGAKSAKTSHILGDDDDGALEDATQADSGDEEAEADKSPTDGVPPVKIVIRAEKLPDDTPKGPNGAWVCDEDDDCAFVERNPEESEGRQRIQQHIKQVHREEDEDQVERINLAMLEGSRGQLPIDNLLDKIRRMGGAANGSQRGDLDGQAVPHPIKRRLLI